ncbi:MAG: hypothetical protein ACPGQQ_00850 [Candidatus Puniceispirillaceae bacterium]
MLYYEKETKDVLTLMQLQHKHRNVSFGVIDDLRRPSNDWLEDNGYEAVIETPKPKNQKGKKAVPDGIKKVNGVYKTQWKIEKLPYRDARAQEYDPIGDQLDAILKQINHDRLNGKELVQDMDDTLSRWLSVKARHPKPED